MIKKRNIFFFAFMFPPWQGPASIRISKFVKYLTRLGWNCVVITSDTGPIREVYYDEQLVNEIPPSVKVIKIRSFLPHRNNTSTRGNNKSFFNMQKYFKEIVYHLIFPDHYILWSFFALLAARKLVKKDDIVITTLSPYSTALVGLFLKMMYDIKWVIDYRDGWTTDPFYKFTKIKKLFESILELCCLKLTDAVTCVSEPLKNDINRTFNICDKILVIENGLDFEDYKFEASDNLFENDMFNLVYTGMISVRNRDISQLIYALDILINQNNIKNIKTYFIGPIYDTYGDIDSIYNKLVNKLDLEKYIFFIPPVSRHKSLAYQQQASCLLLIYTSKSDLDSVMSSKIFEYIYTKKPILGLINRSAARELIETHQLGVCADPLNQYEIAESILKIYNNPSNYPNKAYFDKLSTKYDRKNLTLKLSNLLEKL